MAKAPGESRIPFFGSKIPMPGRSRFGTKSSATSEPLPACQPNPSKPAKSDPVTLVQRCISSNLFKLKSSKPDPKVNSVVLNNTYKVKEPLPSEESHRDLASDVVVGSRIMVSNCDLDESVNMEKFEENRILNSTIIVDCNVDAGFSKPLNETQTMVKPNTKRMLDTTTCIEGVNAKCVKLNETTCISSSVHAGIPRAEFIGQGLATRTNEVNSTFTKEEPVGEASGPYSILMGIMEENINKNMLHEVKDSSRKSTFISSSFKCQVWKSSDSPEFEPLINKGTTSTPTDDCTEKTKPNAYDSLGQLSPPVWNASLDLVTDLVAREVEETSNRKHDYNSETVFTPKPTPASPSGEHAPRPFVLGSIVRNPNRLPMSPLAVQPTKSPIYDNPTLVSAPNCLPLSPHGKEMSKQNSFEFDDSLGILTPDQMESSMFVNTPPRVHSSDDLKSSVSHSKRSDKTLSAHSRTPSTESVKSITPDDRGNCSHVVHTMLLNPNEELETSIESVGTLVNETIQDISINDGTVIIVSKDLDTTLQPLSALEHVGPLASFSAAGWDDSLLSHSVMEDDLLASLFSNVLDPVSSLVDTTMNLDLPLDPINGDERSDRKQTHAICRVDQTPSPEDLPLDPVDVKTDLTDQDLCDIAARVYQEQSQADSESKTDMTKSGASKVSNSFITSVTSITSLDTGYQGDGEMSRPASRGADHSPSIGHRPNERPMTEGPNQWRQPTISRRPDPMTDSDFFTESDADGCDDTAQKGDRKAQVIDGQLYGGQNNSAQRTNANPPPAEDSCMESSGVYTDLENRISPPPLPHVDAMSPDVSSKTISTTSECCSQKNVEGPIRQNTYTAEPSDKSRDLSNHSVVPGDAHMSSERETATSDLSMLSEINVFKSVKSVSKEDQFSKKYKMPSKTAPNKMKPKLEIDENQENRRPSSKKCNKWDAVMNKIAVNKATTKTKPKLAEVKSKVATGITGSSKPGHTGNKTGAENRLGILGQASSNSVRSLNQTATKSKSRRTRIRSSESNLMLAASKSSQHSSQSDLSVGNPTPNKSPIKHGTSPRVTKKREVSRIDSPLSEPAVTANVARQATTRAVRPITLQKRGLSPAIVSTSHLTGGGGPVTDPKVPRKVVPTRRVVAQRSSPLKDHNRLVCSGISGNQPTGGAQRVVLGSPSPLRSPPPLRSPHGFNGVTQSPLGSPKVSLRHAELQKARLVTQLSQSARGVEALGVLVQYMAFQLDAFACPQLKRDNDSKSRDLLDTRLLLDETRAACMRLEHQLTDRTDTNSAAERKLSELQQELVRVKSLSSETDERIRTLQSELVSRDAANQKTTKEILDERDALQIAFKTFQDEYELLKTTAHRNELDLLKHLSAANGRENELTAKLERIEADFVDKLHTSLEMERDALGKLDARNKEFDALKKHFETTVTQLNNKASLLQDELVSLRKTRRAAERDLTGSSPKRSQLLQDEVESLRTVLELKQEEVADLRKQNQESGRASEELQAALIKLQTLESRVEDLQVQLQRKVDNEKDLGHRVKILQESIHQESKQKTRLSQYNEELQWKLKQNHEVVNVLAALTNNAHSPHKVQTGLEPETGCQTQSFVRSHSRNNSMGRTLNKPERKSSFRELDKPRAAYNSNNSYNEQQSDSCDSKSCGSDRNKSVDCFDMDDISPPSSPKIKAVLEKSDSVSWVLEMDEAPEIVASRIVRRAGSFRNSTPPPNFARSVSSVNKLSGQSPVPKRQRCANNTLCQSASSSAILRQSVDASNDTSRVRSKSVSIKTPGGVMRCSLGNPDDWQSEICSSTPLHNRSKEHRERSSSFSSPPKSDALVIDRAGSFNTGRSLITCDTTVLTSNRPTLPSATDLIRFAGDSEEESQSGSSDDSESSLDSKHRSDSPDKASTSPMHLSWSDNRSKMPSESDI